MSGFSTCLVSRVTGQVALASNGAKGSIQKEIRPVPNWPRFHREKF
jgi:hypothetical protein